MWVDSGTLPHVSYFSSFINHTAPLLRVSDVREANKILKEIMDLVPCITFNKAGRDGFEMDFLNFSEASFNIFVGRYYDQTGIITGLKTKIKNLKKLFYIIDWAITNQIGLSDFSYGTNLWKLATQMIGGLCQTGHKIYHDE